MDGIEQAIDRGIERDRQERRYDDPVGFFAVSAEDVHQEARQILEAAFFFKDQALHRLFFK